jgi:hypothetical protein
MENFVTNLLLISHHEFSPSFLSLWTFHLLFINESVPFRAGVFWKGFEEILINLVIQSKTR